MTATSYRIASERTKWKSESEKGSTSRNRISRYFNIVKSHRIRNGAGRKSYLFIFIIRTIIIVFIDWFVPYFVFNKTFSVNSFPISFSSISDAAEPWLSSILIFSPLCRARSQQYQHEWWVDDVLQIVDWRLRFNGCLLRFSLLSALTLSPSLFPIFCVRLILCVFFSHLF